MIWNDVGSSHWWPNVIVPRQTSDTFRPVRPSRRGFIGDSVVLRCERRPGLLYAYNLRMPAWLTALLTHPVTLLSVGGALGTNARYWLSVLIATQRWTEQFPL